MWHAAQYTDYGSAGCTCVPQLILILLKLIPRKNSRRSPIYPKTFVQEGIKIVLLWKRHTQRKLAALMGVSKTTVHHWIGGENKVARLLIALHFRDPQDLMKYWDMHDWIHLDEKWFLLTQEKERYLLLLEEKNPKWCIKHKSHITKLMFLCAIAHPRFNPSANSWWDDKLGLLARWCLGTS